MLWHACCIEILSGGLCFNEHFPGEALWLRGFFEAAWTFHASFSSDHGSLGGCSFMVDIFLPLPETSAVKHNRESGQQSCFCCFP